MNFMCSLIVVENIEKSRTLYEEVLGQRVQMDFGENVAFEGGFAIHQKEHYKMLINNAPIAKKSNNFELYFEDDDLEVVQDTIKGLGLEFLHEIVEQPWRQKVVRFYDYDKNIIEVGERMQHVAYRLSREGMNIDEISKITYLPKELVAMSIQEYAKR